MVLFMDNSNSNTAASDLQAGHYSRRPLIYHWLAHQYYMLKARSIIWLSGGKFWGND